MPAITFVIGGREFKLLPKDYILTPIFSDHKICVSAFNGRKKGLLFVHHSVIALICFLVEDFEPSVWTLGMKFMSRYYTIFDAGQRRIGLAESRNEYA